MDIIEFKNLFGLPFNNFSEPTLFIDDEFGFSFLKDKNQNGRNFASLYRIFINKDEFNNSSDIKNITAMVSYGEKTQDGILLTPKNIKPSISWPIEIISTDDFKFNIEDNKFYYLNSEISPQELIKKLEEFHTKPTKIARGFILRLKLSIFRILIPFLIGILFEIFKGFLYFISGSILSETIWTITLKSNSSKEQYRKNNSPFATEKVQVFGYQASAWAVVAYCLLHLVIYSYFFYKGISNIFIQSIFANAFLTLAYVIPSLVIFERIAPLIIEKIIIKLAYYYQQSAFKKIEI